MNTDTVTPSHSPRLARSVRLCLAGLAAVGVASCGSDKSDTKATTAPRASTPASAPINLEAYCAVATELDQSESFPPTAALLTRYVGAAPAEVADATAVAARLIPLTEDPLAFFAAFAEDDLEAAVAELDAFEAATCGLDKDPPVSEGSTRELESGAARVDVVATDYAFEAPDTLSPGRTSFVLINNGKEAHFLHLVKLVPGIAVDDALQAEDPSTVTEGEWESGLAAPGGDEEVLTVDLEPGTYAVLCWVPGPAGDPHTFMGMKGEIVVS